jgi:hypothetical protein
MLDSTSLTLASFVVTMLYTGQCSLLKGSRTPRSWTAPHNEPGMCRAKLQSVGNLGGQAAHPSEIVSRLIRPRQVLLHALKKRFAGPARE